MVGDILTAMRIKVSPEPIKFKMTPSAQDLDTCFEFGKKFAMDLGGKAA
jgi:flavorubredoxin